MEVIGVLKALHAFIVPSCFVELNHPLMYPIISHGTHLKSPSWARGKNEQTHDRKHPNDPDTPLKMSDHFQTVETHKKP